MAQLRWTAEAEASLRDIYEYIARDRPATAHRTVESIIHRAEALVEFPQLGKPYPYLSEHSVRILTYGEFQIAYQTVDDRAISILGVFHGLIFLPLK